MRNGGVVFALFISLYATSLLGADNTNTNTTTNTSSSTSTSENTSSSTSTNTSSSNNTSATTINHKNQPVAGARSPSVTVTNSDVCVAGISAGAQTNMVGISLAGTLSDETCERIKLSRELRKSGMKVASVALLCQDARVFQAMIMSGTPCPAKGKIGDEAASYWNSYPELRPDFEQYTDNFTTLVDAGYINEDGSLVQHLVETEPKERKIRNVFKWLWWEDEDEGEEVILDEPTDTT